MESNKEHQMRKIAARFLMPAICLCIVGCASPLYTRDECLAIVKAKGVDLELSEPQVLAEKVRNPMFLVGTWWGEQDMAEMSVVPHWESDVWHKRYTWVYDFRTDGTYTCVFGVPEADNQMILDKSRVFGTWKMEGDLLVLRETSIYDGIVFYRDLEYRKHVLRFGHDAIGFQFVSRRDMQKAETERFRQHISNSRFSAMLRTPQIDAGYDRQNREVLCRFHPHKGNKGTMIVTVLPNVRYVRTPRPSMQLAAVTAANAPKPSPSNSADRRASSKQASCDGFPKYVLERFAWDRESDWRCGFEYKIDGECTLQLLSEIERDARAYIRNSYLSSHLMADAQSVSVDARLSFINGQVVGTGSVLMIDGTLSYDATTRRGIVSIRFRAGQYEEARTWVRRNIETLVRDKNILLDTGDIPPPGHYISGDERVVETQDGKMLEMEFKSE